MKKFSIIWLIIIVVIIAIAIWYWSAGQPNSSSSASATASSSSSTAAPSFGAEPANILVLNTASTTQLGAFLVAMNGMTLYEYTKDTPGVSACTGQCAAVWPPYTIPASEASSSLVGGMGASGQVGVIMRADGSYQVTYNDTPLYFYSKDTNIGDTAGQNVGDVWFVVSP